MPLTFNLETFANAARNCAMQMMSSAGYIQAELPKLMLPKAVEDQITAVCESLIGTKHDIISELFKLSEALEASASPVEIKGRVERIISWLGETIQELNEVVRSLQTLAVSDDQLSITTLLMVESANNILEPFNRASEIVEALQGTP